MTAAIGVVSAVADPLTDATGVRVELVPFQGQEILFPSPDTLVFNDETFRRAKA